MRRRHLLWAPEHPNLIDAEVELIDERGNVADRVESYFGLRRIEVQDGRFILNGVPTFLRLILAQNYWPDSLSGGAVGRALFGARSSWSRSWASTACGSTRRSRIRASFTGATASACWCGRKRPTLTSIPTAPRKCSPANGSRQFDATTTTRASSPGCRSTKAGAFPISTARAQQRDFVRALYHLTKAIDPTRPVIANDGWQHAVGDIFGVHDYAPTGDMLRERYADRERGRSNLPRSPAPPPST